ncbi:D-serine ammonia-lyase [Salicibibacter cibi]|uniref:Probable D-serine dehydratase n=1 Tax=Salicibibacter cibi TaxID=2743001 RepID=A0A7T6ZB95_9BACI|nr:D-serine ammonia-lyase [Salicibibacter cibi]QQK80333.1 D-serine ammonia-lyase [Salicibibacter cibi]
MIGNSGLGKTWSEWTQSFPLLEDIMEMKPVFWQNPSRTDATGLPVSEDDIEEAKTLWRRFAPFIKELFPETKASDGIVESPLRSIPKMQQALERHYHARIRGRLYLKCDNELPIAGSIKARGGVYEVLKYAETLAIEQQLITKEKNYEQFASPKFKHFFKQYSIGVASTGNLGLSIGIISAALGFNVTVHMSADAKEWKKELLREKGATVREYNADFSRAIARGRELSSYEPNSYFIDDENSRDLFLGYSVAALRLKDQLESQGIYVDADNPLFVYLPCGVGGSPGGITFGLKSIFGPHAHCFFVEPTHSPSVLIGLLTGQKEKVSVRDFGLDNLTEADGLAVGRPSSFATEISEKLVSGNYTIHDNELFKLLTLLMDTEEIKVEPSAASGLQGPILLNRCPSYIDKHHLSSKMHQATHIAWSTGGSLVPDEEMRMFYEKGKTLMSGNRVGDSD